MNTRPTTILFALAGVALLFGWNLFSQEDPAAPPRAWEHLAFEVGHETSLKDPELAEKINQLGNNGWQLVDVETRTQMGNTSSVLYFFKRPK